MTINIKELRDRAATLGSDYLTDEEWVEVIDRLEAAEKERDELRTELNEIRYGVAVAHDTIKALRAKITEMERQEPVWFIDERGEPKRYHKSKADYCKYGGLDLLYALPGAQPAPSAPDGWKLVPIDPTQNMLDRMDLGSNMLYRYRALLAAAPEVKL